MGYRKVPTIYSLTFAEEEYEGFEIRMKGLKVGRIRRLIKAVDSEDKSTDSINEILSLFEEGLVSWNLEDEIGVPVPTTREGIEEQDVDFVMDIVSTWLDGMTGTGADLGKGSSSGETSPVELPTMEAL
jgi:predicted type IV restriction endonuclease